MSIAIPNEAAPQLPMVSEKSITMHVWKKLFSSPIVSILKLCDRI
jgi:hypothetical protein